MTRPGGAGLPESNRGGLRLAFRMARRMTAMTIGRSILVGLLIAVPIIGLVAIDTIEASHTSSPEQTARLQLGQNQSLVYVMSAPDPKLRQDPFQPTFTDTASKDVPTSGPTVKSISEILPAGTRAIPLTFAQAVTRTKHGVGYFGAVEGEPWAPSMSGMYDLVDGTRPTKAGEIMVSPAALARFGIEIGGTVTVEQPVKGTFTVVGTLRAASDTSDTVALYGRSGVFDGIDPTVGTDPSTGTQVGYYLPDLKLDWPAVRKLNAQGATALSREVLLDPPPASVAKRFTDMNPPNVGGVLSVAAIGAFALFEVCLLAGAAFAVGARKRQRELAILTSVGASRGTVFAVMSVEGVILGFLGGVLGSGIGIAAAAVAEPLLANGSASQFPGFRVDWPVIALIVAASTLSGWLAAAVPARTASKVDVVAALRGARRPVKPSTRRPIVGLFVAAAGSVIALMGGLVIIASSQTDQHGSNRVLTGGIVLLVSGPIIMQIGMLLIAPLLLRLASTILARLGTGARLGGRDAARNPTRTVPALAVIMSTVFLSAFAMCGLTGGQALNVRDHMWNAPLNAMTVSLYKYGADSTATLLPSSGVVTAVDRVFPGTTTRVLSSTPDFPVEGTTPPTYTVLKKYGDKQQLIAYLNGTGSGDHLLVGTADDLRAILGRAPSSEAVAMLERGGLVSLYPQYVKAGKATLDTVSSAGAANYDQGTPLKSTAVPAVVDAPKQPISFGAIISPETAAKLGVPYAPSSTFTQLPTTPTNAQRDAITGDLQVVDLNLYPDIELGPEAFAQGWAWAIVGITTLIALGAAAIALALAKADSRRDDDVLVAVGASPRIQRSFGFWQAALITGLGAVIGVGLGLVPAFALGLRGAGVTHGYLPFDPPWLQLVATAIVMPLLISAGVWLTSRRARYRPRFGLV